MNDITKAMCKELEKELKEYGVKISALGNLVDRYGMIIVNRKGQFNWCWHDWAHDVKKPFKGMDTLGSEYMRDKFKDVVVEYYKGLEIKVGDRYYVSDCIDPMMCMGKGIGLNMNEYEECDIEYNKVTCVFDRDSGALIWEDLSYTIKESEIMAKYMELTYDVKSEDECYVMVYSGINSRFEVGKYAYRQHVNFGVFGVTDESVLKEFVDEMNKMKVIWGE